MRLQITQKGAHGPDGPLAVGDVLDLPGDAIPAWLKGKARVLADEVRTAVTNPAASAVQEPQASGQDRQTVLGEIAVAIDAEGFGSDGVPDVRAINRALPESAAKFTAGERDQLWPGIADAVMARRG